MSESWEHIETFADEISAEAFAGSLRASGVPVEVLVQSQLPGMVTDVKVRVPSSLVHRARFIIKSVKLTDAELTFAATGELGSIEDSES